MLTGFEGIVGLFFLWSFMGVFVTVPLIVFYDWDYPNPIHLYHFHYRLNWFGTAMLTLLYNLICPIYTIGYWFYKLCTVGRK